MMHMIMGAPAPFTVDEFWRTFWTAALSAPVLVGFGAGGLKLWQQRKESRLAERKDTRSEDNDLVAQWKLVAENAQAEVARSVTATEDRVRAERESKESAIATVRSLLELQEGQNAALRDTIQRLTDTIERLSAAGGAAADLVGELQAERDRLVRDLAHAQERIATLTSQLMRRQQDLLGTDDLSTRELAVLDRELQAKVDTGEIPLNGTGARA
jgi:hypothetical protein